MFLMLGYQTSSVADEWTRHHRAMLRSIEADVRRNSRVLGRDHLSEAVATAMARVRRHLFVPPEFRDAAYANHPLPIGQGQTISQPTIVALMTDLMAVTAQDTVLEVGTGSGYQAAVLSHVAARVHTIEIVPELARSAKQRLADLGYDNVVVVQGDGYRGLPEVAPFAAIMVTAAAPEVPTPLLEQLKPGGRLVIPVGPQGDTQWLTVWTKDAEGGFSRQAVLPVRFVPLTGEGQARNREGPTDQD